MRNAELEKLLCGEQVLDACISFGIDLGLDPGHLDLFVGGVVTAALVAAGYDGEDIKAVLAEAARSHFELLEVDP